MEKKFSGVEVAVIILAIGMVFAFFQQYKLEGQGIGILTAQTASLTSEVTQLRHRHDLLVAYQNSVLDAIREGRPIPPIPDEVMQ